MLASPLVFGINSFDKDKLASTKWDFIMLLRTNFFKGQQQLKFFLKHLKAFSVAADKIQEKNCNNSCSHLGSTGKRPYERKIGQDDYRFFHYYNQTLGSHHFLDYRKFLNISRGYDFLLKIYPKLKTRI